MQYQNTASAFLAFFPRFCFLQAPSKASHLSSRINEEIKRVATVMGVVCLFGAFLTTLWNAKVRKNKKRRFLFYSFWKPIDFCPRGD